MTAAAGLAILSAGLASWLMAPARWEPPGAGRHPPRARLVMVAVLLLVAPRALAVPALILAAAGGGGRVLWRRRSAARLAAGNAVRLAETCDLLAAELAAGRPAEVALGQAADAWAVIRPVAEACRLGGDVPAALQSAAATPGASGLRLLAAAWSIALRTGGGLGPATSRVADAVRRDQATRRVVAGELASARATARLVAVLPLVALLMGSGAGADPWSFLLGTPWGWACLGAGLSVGWSGLWWIELVAREAEP